MDLGKSGSDNEGGRVRIKHKHGVALLLPLLLSVVISHDKAG